MKLTDRFSVASTERLKQIIANFQNNIEVELQQRSCEYSKLFAWDNVRKALLERIPIVEEQKERAAPSVTIKQTQNGGSLIEMWEENPSSSPLVPQTTAPAPVAPVSKSINLMEELFGPSTVTPVTSAPVKAVDPILELLGGPITPTPTPSPFMTPFPTPLPTGNLLPFASPVMPLAASPVNGPLPPFTAFEKNGLKVVFEPVKNAQFPNITVVNATFTNSGPAPLVNFDFKAAVPKYLKMQVNPPSGNLISPNNEGRVTQSLKLMNSEHGQKPLLLKIKIDYLVNGVPASEVADVNFPRLE